MGIRFKVTIAACAVSLAAGVLIAVFLKSENTDQTDIQPYVTKYLRPASTDEFVPAGLNRTGSHTIDGIEILEQLPDLPTGCEVTSLTMVLNYMGFEADKLDIARDYLEKQEFERDDDDNLYGPDFRYVFPGDPENDTSFGCLAPCIVSAAKKYLDENDLFVSPVDLTGASFYELLSFVEYDVPVILWTTLDLAEPEYIWSWETPEGEKVTWPTNEHCVVLSAFDYDNNTVQFHDPMMGIVTYDMDRVIERYEQIGKNAVVIINKK